MFKFLLFCMLQMFAKNNIELKNFHKFFAIGLIVIISVLIYFFLIKSKKFHFSSTKLTKKLTKEEIDKLIKNHKPEDQVNQLLNMPFFQEIKNVFKISAENFHFHFQITKEKSAETIEKFYNLFNATIKKFFC